MSVQPSQSRTVGDYTLLAKLGEGGMGVVHLARKGDGPRVALKVLRPHIVGDDEARARLAREVSSLERIRSRWIAEIVDADPWAATPYVATRYVPGLSLHDHVPEEGPIVGDDLWWFARCLAEGVASVHSVGVLHRDVKPSNVLLEGRTPILIDFGLARVADDPKLTHTGWLLGTPGYLAPEILFGDDATTASDVHSWAATVAFAGTGHPPFGRGPSMAIMDRVRRGEHDLTGLPDDLRVIVAAALEPDPARRPSLGELRSRLAERQQPARPMSVVRPLVDDDPFTIPLALAAHDGAAAATWLAPAPAAPTPGRPFDPRSGGPFDQMAGAPADQRSPGPFDPPTRPLTVPMLGEIPAQLDAGQPHESRATTARRAVLLTAVGLVAVASVAAWPYPTLVTLLLVSWLLRACTMLAAARSDRRRLRGIRWYDVLLAPISAPWYVVAAVPGTVLLGLWAAGITLAGGLLCYALSAGPVTTLVVAGACLVLGLWVGPGSTQVRWPLRLATQPLVRRTGRWAVTVALLLALTGVVGHLASEHTSWSPFGHPTARGR